MSRQGWITISLVGAVLFAIAGYYEWSQTLACHAHAANCVAGAHRHPNRAYGLWFISAVLVVVGGWLAITRDR